MMDYAVNWQTEAVQRRRQMKADREAFAGRISILDRNALLALALSLYDEMEEMRLKHLENERISTEAHIQFSELNAKYTAAIAENENLKKLLQNILNCFRHMMTAFCSSRPSMCHKAVS